VFWHMPQKEQAARRIPRLAKIWKVWLSYSTPGYIADIVSLDAEWLDSSTKIR
jgi:hypothetical protein